MSKYEVGKARVFQIHRIKAEIKSLPSPPHPTISLGTIVYMETTSKQLVVCSGRVFSSHVAKCECEVEKTEKDPPQDRVKG